jgi:hypothetical protein
MSATVAGIFVSSGSGERNRLRLSAALQDEHDLLGQVVLGSPRAKRIILTADAPAGLHERP